MYLVNLIDFFENIYDMEKKIIFFEIDISVYKMIEDLMI